MKPSPQIVVDGAGLESDVEGKTMRESRKVCEWERKRDTIEKMIV